MDLSKKQEKKVITAPHNARKGYGKGKEKVRKNSTAGFTCPLPCVTVGWRTVTQACAG